MSDGTTPHHCVVTLRSGAAGQLWVKTWADRIDVETGAAGGEMAMLSGSGSRDHGSPQ